MVAPMSFERNSVHKVLMYAVLFAFNLSCIPNNGDFSSEFGGYYTLFQFSRDDVRIIFTPGIDIQKEGSVPAKVIRCNFDENFIIAQQQLLKRKYPNDPNRSVEIPDPGKFQYWIIVKAAQQRHGPFTAEEFEVQRKALGVPESLELLSKDSFRSR